MQSSLAGPTERFGLGHFRAARHFLSHRTYLCCRIIPCRAAPDEDDALPISTFRIRRIVGDDPSAARHSFSLLSRICAFIIVSEDWN